MKEGKGYKDDFDVLYETNPIKMYIEKKLNSLFFQNQQRQLGVVVQVTFLALGRGEQEG